ncbi:MAG: single-stranded DNA-binding protein [Anaerovoracaceae bacterium]|jgi:single-strand DNA-binding protein
MNAVVLIGRLTRDPETRYVPQNELAVTNFTLAVDRPMAKEKTADFIRIVSFGKTAELCERYLAKGRLVAVQGRIQTGQYKDKNGETRYTTDVVADRVQFLEWGDKNERSEKIDGGDFNQPSLAPGGFTELDDDDIPF